MPPSRLFLADEELGKKDDDHRPKTRWQSTALGSARRRRLLLTIFSLCLAYMFFKNMPTDAPAAQSRMKSKFPASQDVMHDTPLPEPSSDPPPRGESSTGQNNDSYYEGELQFYSLARTLKLFPSQGRNGPSSATIFAAASLRSVSDMLPLACLMANRKLNTVHFALMGRDDVSIEGIQQVNGIDKANCPINWHDARVDYAQWSTDGRMEQAVAAALTYIRSELQPQVLITQGGAMEEQSFLRGIRKSRELGLSHVTLPSTAGELMWIAALDSQALQNWNNVNVEILIHASPDSSGSLMRLIKSLQNSDFLGFSPGLTIELPSRVSPDLLRYLEEMKWLPAESGSITIRRRISTHRQTPREASLRLVEAFYPKDPNFSHVLVLSPDAELAPSFYHYLMYTVLKYRYSTRASMLPSKLFGISLELPSERLTKDETSIQPKIEDTQFSNRNSPKALPLFLWQAPNSNAALYFGDKWAETHSFLGRRVAVAEAHVFKDENTISKRHPAFMEHLLELFRARGYYLLYPAFSGKGRFSLATLHHELLQIPEEFVEDSDASLLSETLRKPASPERLLGTDPNLMPLLDTFSLELPDISLLPIICHRGEEMSEYVFGQATADYQRDFRVRYGGCPAKLNDEMEGLFCAE